MSYPVRAAAVLTTSYVEGTVVPECHQFNQLVIEVDYTQGSLTSLQIKVEFSRDGGTFRRELNVATSGATNTLTPSEYSYSGGDGSFDILLPIDCNEIKISAKGTGTVTGSELTLGARLAFVG